ncbi:MAG TPA: branched-chain amino acid transaminase [Terriglobales bacterium]|nr:branched-chain amino acid transaminase [Terriglobales bacterium]
MALAKTEKIWHNGKFIPFDEARIHVLAHVVSYGSSLFEGIRCYQTGAGPAVFRLGDHIERLLNSCKIYRIDVGFSHADLAQGCIDLVRENRMAAAYLRPIVLRGFGGMGVMPSDNPIEVFIAAWDWGRYLGQEAQDLGVDVCVSSWRRMAPDTLPAMAKAAANYMNSQLMKMEAAANGYVEAIALDAQGLVSEGSGENLFLVRKGVLVTPPLTNSVLPGITRDTILQLGADLGIPTREEPIAREALYLADELFFSGTAVEITPIRSVDRISIGRGGRGEITAALQRRFFDLVTGKRPDQHGWLTPVESLEPARR